MSGVVAPIADAYFGKPAPLILLSALLVVVQAVPLWWRRRFPLLVLLVVTAPPLIRSLIGLSVNNATVAVVFAVYAVSVYDRPRVRIWVAVAVAAAIVAGVTLAIAGVRTGRGVELVGVGPISLIAWVMGDFVRSRRRMAAEVAARLEAARAQAAEEERLRIARELHDVVAHNVSLMAVQAGAARVSGNSGASALQSIETTARDTLAELNRLLGVLRKDASGAARDPQPGLSGVDALLKPAREAGLDVTLKVSGEQRPLPAALDLSAYRIVQEALTNVMKHAHATRAEVLIDYEPNAVTLTVSDNGQGSSTAVGASRGHGLIGMRERVELFGGELGAGSSSLGGFTVRVRLPVT